MKNKMMMIALGCLVLAGCNMAPFTPPEDSGCDPWIDGSFINPPRPNPAWRHTGELSLGDVKSQRLAAKRILKAPVGWDAPERLSNNDYCTPLKYQGADPWCAAYSIEQMLGASYWRLFHHKHDFPVGQIYSRAKSYSGGSGDGTTLEGVTYAIQKLDFGLDVKPAISDADLDPIYELDDVLFGIHKYGLVLVGLQITEGWNKLDPNGFVGPDTKPIGGHAVLVSGYSKKLGLIWGPNWWGLDWGRNGWWVMTFEQFSEQLGYGYAFNIKWEQVAK